MSSRTETFTDLSLPITSDSNISYINTRLSCNSVVLHKDQPHAHVFVSRGWLWWIIRKIFRQVTYVIFGQMLSPEHLLVLGHFARKIIVLNAGLHLYLNVYFVLNFPEMNIFPEIPSKLKAKYVSNLVGVTVCKIFPHLLILAKADLTISHGNAAAEHGFCDDVALLSEEKCL